MGNNLLPANLGSSFAVKQVHSGDGHRCVLSTDARVKCFGEGEYGKLGSGATTDIKGIDFDLVPDVIFPVGFTVTALSSGSGYIVHHCAISADNNSVSKLEMAQLRMHCLLC